LRKKEGGGGGKQQYALILITHAQPLCPCRKKYYQYSFCTKRGLILNCIHALHCHVFVLGVPLSYRSLLTNDISICMNALQPLYDVASTGGAQNPAKMETRLAYVAVVTRTGMSFSGMCIKKQSKMEAQPRLRCCGHARGWLSLSTIGLF